MSRRVSLPGADELFRATAPLPADEHDWDAAGPPSAPAVYAVPAPAEPDPVGPDAADAGGPSGPRRRARRERRPSGRERHEEKITVYVSADELVDLERARLTLRAEHGLAVDRGRIVREALTVVLADLEAKGESSILVRRLTGR